jgi:hypothetical protein
LKSLSLWLKQLRRKEFLAVAKKIKTDGDEPGKISKAKPRASSTPAKTKKTAKKPAVSKLAKETTPAALAAFDPTDEQIELRAYFIAERRHRLALPGDANSDWLEAKRQLLAETRR